MLLIILLSLIRIVLSNSISLNHIYEEEVKLLDQRYKAFGSLKDTNLECVKQKLKLSVNGEKLIAQKLGENVVHTAALLCLDDKSIYEKMLKYILKDIISFANLECYKKRLQELQADSKLLNNFIPDSSINCNETITKTEYNKEELQELEVYDCVMDKKIIIERIGIKNVLLHGHLKEANEISDDIKKEMFEEMDSLNEILLECSLKIID
ncbi:hypothetical protein PVAND_014626 [Polypedilum vanderplanki]|uniref:Uncharacterized protein n=1 Tax=Polypedilum vanderplanki TaxID=319348 RepID=A0A9J6BA85_POLVA|nr:hypothetical protein PVAND_014626 [Polypedilum vanderplanki]